jgi:hypothetical protein
MASGYGWSCVSGVVPWSPRDGAQLVSLNGRLFLLGGWNQYAESNADLAGAGAGTFDSEVCSEVWASDSAGASWEFVGAAPWSS